MASPLVDVNDGMSYGDAAKAHNVPKTTLICHYKGKIRSPYKFGRRLALLRTEEFDIAQNLAALEDFGMAFSVHELQDFIKHYLDSNGREVNVSRENRPGVDWVSAFLKRHRGLLMGVRCNISRVGQKRINGKECNSPRLENLLLEFLRGVN